MDSSHQKSMIIKLHEWLLIVPVIVLSYGIVFLVGSIVAGVFDINVHNDVLQFFWVSFLLLPLALPISGFIGSILSVIILYKSNYRISSFNKVAYFIHPLSLLFGSGIVFFFFWISLYT